MRDRARPAGRLETLISELGRARQGSVELDVMTAYSLGKVPPDCRRAADLLVDKGFEWGMIANLWDTEIPAFTRSLDATVPGERIVATLQLEAGGRWAAVQRTAEGADIIGRGTTEILARRCAALKGLAPEATNCAIAGRVGQPNGRERAGRTMPPAAEVGESIVDQEEGWLGEGRDPVLAEESEWKIRF